MRNIESSFKIFLVLCFPIRIVENQSFFFQICVAKMPRFLDLGGFEFGGYVGDRGD
jgi:hypothetical protein